MLVVGERDIRDFPSWLATEAGFIENFCVYDGEPVVLEPYQPRFLENRSRFRWVTKSRQVGFSFLCALARAHLRDGYTAVFVSYNMPDALEKPLLRGRDDVASDLNSAAKFAFVNRSKSHWNVVASAFIGQGRRLAQMSSYAEAGIESYVFEAVLDEVLARLGWPLHFGQPCRSSVRLLMDARHSCPHAHFHHTDFAFLSLTSDGVSCPFFDACHSRASSGYLLASVLSFATRYPLQNGHPLPLVRPATTACHSWSGTLRHFHHTFSLQNAPTSLGFEAPFFVGCHSMAKSGRFAASEFSWRYR
jgi:hypothetical protein